MNHFDPCIHFLLAQHCVVYCGSRSISQWVCNEQVSTAKVRNHYNVSQENRSGIMEEKKNKQA